MKWRLAVTPSQIETRNVTVLGTSWVARVDSMANELHEVLRYAVLITGLLTVVESLYVSLRSESIKERTRNHGVQRAN